MLAVVRRNKQLVCDEIAEPVPAAGQVLVRTLCCGICGSDLHALHSFENMLELGARAGTPSTVDPAGDIVFGHEFCAEILDHGPDTAKSLKSGTRVVSMPIALRADGFDAIGYSNNYPGGFAERMVLTEAMLLAVPNGLSDVQAAMTEPFAVGEHAVALSDIGPDSAYLVIGCGPVGLAVIAALKSRGLGPVIASDFSPARRAVAERVGADVIVDPTKESPHGRWSALGVPVTGAERTLQMMTGKTGKRAVIFECVGVPGVLQGIIEAAPTGSQVIVAGVCMETDRIEPFLCISKQLDFRFVLGYSPIEFAATLHNIAEGKIDVLPAVTSEVGLAGVAAAFAALADPEAQCKIVVRPGA
ncbi:alcohol dehydrogenase [Polymorphobacter glacialis]|uniref:Alcohol dehydrogenase n=1 Tax=Sandarakinorhabdus glacialis TaxID=1614636 RepID=A0A917E7V6_9SPHN|nr:zinc-binding dehydrogenase [Polymorphobacter glacialis]GGE13628.1 alcohol dehydrogenase [Polymorphobacter glacialis]